MQNLHGTTILSVRKDGEAVIAADGQVSLGSNIFKGRANKLRSVQDGKIFTGFAGSAADGLTLFERLEGKLQQYNFNVTRACVELAKDWRTDKYLRRLEAMLIVMDINSSFILSGTGDVIEPDESVAAIGSGGFFARSAAVALLDVPGYDAEQIARKAMKIAADVCVYTNHNLILHKVKA